MSKSQWATRDNEYRNEQIRVAGCFYKIENYIPVWLQKCIDHSLLYFILSSRGTLLQALKHCCHKTRLAQKRQLLHKLEESSLATGYTMRGRKPKTPNVRNASANAAAFNTTRDGAITRSQNTIIALSNHLASLISDKIKRQTAANF